jgi:hypothetical protein
VRDLFAVAAAAGNAWAELIGTSWLILPGQFLGALGGPHHGFDKGHA